MNNIKVSAENYEQRVDAAKASLQLD